MMCQNIFQGLFVMNGGEAAAASSERFHCSLKHESSYGDPSYVNVCVQL